MLVQIYEVDGRWTFKEPTGKGGRKVYVQVPDGSHFRDLPGLGTELLVPSGEWDGLVSFSHTASHVYDAAEARREGFRFLRRTARGEFRFTGRRKFAGL